MFKKYSFIFILVIALMVIGLVGCGSPKDSEEQAGEGGGEEKGQIIGEDYHIDIYTYYSGTTTYILGAGLADLINNNSDWLSATALESPVPAQNLKMLMEEPDLRKNAIVQGFVYHAEIAAPPFEEPYHDLRELTNYGVSGNTFFTNDPDIKSIEDLDGKRVALGKKPHIAQVDFPLLYLEKLGVEITPEFIGFVAGADALRDGSVDALWTGGLAMDPNFKKWAPIPYLAEILSTEDIYPLSLDKDIHDEAMKELGMPLNPGLQDVPAGAFHESINEPFNFRCEAISWVAHKDMPDEVVKEFLRIIKENADKFKDFVPAGRYITPETMPRVGIPERMHPAAVEFYRENNLKIPVLDD